MAAAGIAVELKDNLLLLGRIIIKTQNSIATTIILISVIVVAIAAAAYYFWLRKGRKPAPQAAESE